MAKKSAKGYMGFSWIISLILAIIPITNVIFGVIERAKKNNILGIILNIILCPIFYVIDLVCIILYNEIKFLA